MATIYSQRNEATYENNLNDFLASRINRSLTLDEKDHLETLVFAKYLSDTDQRPSLSQASTSYSDVARSPPRSPTPLPARTQSPMGWASYSSDDDTDDTFIEVRRPTKRKNSIPNSPPSSPNKATASSSASKKANLNSFEALRSPSPGPSTSMETLSTDHTATDPSAAANPRKYSRIPPIIIHNKKKHNYLVP